MTGYYKVYCEYYIKANNEDDVIEEAREDADFAENHLIIEKVSKKTAEEAGIDIDLTE